MVTRNLLMGAAIAALFSSSALAGVPAEVADRLGKDLTPMGSQKSGNKDGSIPEWKGGLQGPPANVTYKAGDRHPDPFADDKILFTINGQNWKQYDDKLTETSRAMLSTYPDTYKMNVYPGRRSCAQPDAVYATIKQNALNGESSAAGGLYGVIRASAFPIPLRSEELMWNHKAKYRNFKATRQLAFATPTRGGDFTIAITQDEIYQLYGDPSKTKVEELNNLAFKFVSQTIAPARSAGNVTLLHETMDQSLGPRKAWTYSPGTRRVRRAPNIAYDNPLFNSDGLQTFDAFGLFNGATDRYDWTYMGRGEYYMPANNYRLAQRDLQYKDIFLAGGHINQDYPRYELQRAHLVEAKLRPGTRHIYAKRRFWFEEDSWFIHATSAYDGRGDLWRLQETFAITYYEEPVCDRVGVVSYDLNAGRYLVDSFVNQETQISWSADELTEDRYTPDFIRQMGVR